MTDINSGQCIEHGPSFVSFNDPLKVEGEVGFEERLSIQSLNTHNDPENINLKQFITLGGLQRALIGLLAGNLPFYQARIEELLSQYDDIDYGNAIKEKPGSPKTMAGQLIGLIEENTNEHSVDIPFEIVLEKGNTYYKHWKGGISKLRDEGAILRIKNNVGSFPGIPENEIGNQLAGAVAAAEFAGSLSTYLEKILYVFSRNLTDRYSQIDQVRMLQAIFKAYNGRENHYKGDYFELPDNIRDLEPEFSEIFTNLTFMDQNNVERPVIEHRFSKYSTIKLKKEFADDFEQILQNENDIRSEKSKLVFVQNKSDKLFALQSYINSIFAVDPLINKVSIPRDKVVEILGDEYDKTCKMLNRNNIYTTSQKTYDFNGKIFFLETGHPAFFPNEISTVVDNIHKVRSLERDGVINAEDLKICINKFMTDTKRTEDVDTVYKSFKEFYFDTLIPAGTVFKLDDEQYRVLERILKDWEKAINRYNFLISDEGKPELTKFFENNYSFGEYLPNEGRKELAHSLIKVLTTKLRMEKRKRAKKGSTQ